MVGYLSLPGREDFSWQWWEFEPEFDPRLGDPLRALKNAFGRNEAWVRLHGFRAWEGWALTIVGVLLDPSDSDATSPHARYLNFDVPYFGPPQKARIIRALVYVSTEGQAVSLTIGKVRSEFLSNGQTTDSAKGGRR